MIANPPEIVKVPGQGPVIRVDDLVDWLQDEAAAQYRTLRDMGYTRNAAPEDWAHADAWGELADELEGLL